MTKIADKTYLFEQMPVRKALLKQIVPAVISQMIVLIYSLADTYFGGASERSCGRRRPLRSFPPRF